MVSVTNSDLRLASILMRNFDAEHGTSSRAFITSDVQHLADQQPHCPKCTEVARALAIGRVHNLPSLTLDSSKQLIPASQAEEHLDFEVGS